MDKILEWFGEERYNGNIQQAKAFWNGKQKFIASINSSQGYYRQIDDINEMQLLAAENLKDQARLPGVNVPTVIADFGTVSTAKYWGGRVHRDSTGQNINIERAAQDVEQALEIIPRAVNDPQMDAARSIELFRKICRNLETESLWLRAGDLQGPLNTASLVINEEEFLIELYSKPRLIHKFLDGVTDLLIEYVRYVRKESKNKIAGTIWPWTFQPPEFGFGMTEDMMPLLSTGLYKEFGIPYVKKMTDELGSAQIHCCGRWGHHAKNLAESDISVRSVEFWYPHTKIDELEPLADKGVVFVPYMSPDFCKGEFETLEDYFCYLIENTSDKYRFWFVFTAESPQSLRFINEYKTPSFSKTK